jgi:uncharacterized repeat protein (TIGR03803 family)
LDTSGNLTTLHAFDWPEGVFPEGGLIQDAAGNFYGTTHQGGNGDGVGTVFKLDPTGALTILHTFIYSKDGGLPAGDLVRDTAGNLYGITEQGGAYDGGIVYKLRADGKMTILHDFTRGADGGSPNGVIRDAAGNLYGITYAGGEFGWGVVFQLNVKTGVETVLHSFTGKRDGNGPEAGLIHDSSGNLYGTTAFGGSRDCDRGNLLKGCGVVFKIKFR